MDTLISLAEPPFAFLMKVAAWLYDRPWIIGAALAILIALEGLNLLRQRRNETRDPDCIFCSIVAGDAPATIVREWPDAIAIVPIDPVTEGHVLVLPRRHVCDARVNPRLTGRIARRAAEVAGEHHAVNLITSCGEEATQSIKHLHWHVAPRRAGDGLPLLWTGQKRTSSV